MNRNFQISILFFCIISLSAYSQDNAARIQEIKTMYGEIVQLEKSIDSAKQCKERKKITHDNSNTNTPLPFDQFAYKCTLSNGYSTLTGNFTAYESGIKTTFYYKNNELFFVFSDWGAESCNEEHRIYYDKKGKIIKLLEKTNDCSGEMPTKNVEIKDATTQKKILETIDNNLKEILEMLK